MNCRVCNTELEKEYTTCPYCGFANSALLTPRADKSIAYRDELLLKITDISVTAPQYQYDEEKKVFRKIDSPKIYISDGKKCFEKRYTSSSDKWIAHFEGDTKIIIDYTFDQVKKTARAKLHATPNEGIWYLVLHINEKLRLEVSLYAKTVQSLDGSNSSGKWLDTDTVDLDLKN